MTWLVSSSNHGSLTRAQCLSVAAWPAAVRQAAELGMLDGRVGRALLANLLTRLLPESADHRRLHRVTPRHLGAGDHPPERQDLLDVPDEMAATSFRPRLTVERNLSVSVADRRPPAAAGMARGSLEE
jgi:hypothetical protein